LLPHSSSCLLFSERPSVFHAVTSCADRTLLVQIGEF
jgi:hypothetical protein